MKPALVAAILLALVTSVASTAHAQMRGRLTSRPPIPSAGPRPVARPVARPVQPVPIWLPWGIVTLPQPILLAPPPIVEGAPPGGLQLDVQPWSAEVYVDGALAGRVEQFRGYYQHLELPGGTHVITIVATGYEPLTFAVTIIPGKTITQRAALLR
jgi:hypothetical protein